MKSIRLNPELEARLDQLAEQRGESVSEILREAIRQFCDRELGAPTAADRLKDFVGCLSTDLSGADSLSVDTSRKYAASLGEKYRRDQEQAARRRSA